MIRVLGFGNPLAGDDAAGVLVAERLQAHLGGRAKAVDVVVAGMAGHALLDWLAGSDAAILIDAMSSGRPPGTVGRYRLCDGGLQSESEALPLSLRSLTGSLASSHGWSLSQALALARELAALPRCLIVYGIEVGDVELGRTPGAGVLRAVETVVAHVCRDVAKLACTKPI